MATGFEDDFAFGTTEESTEDKVELTDREREIAGGSDLADGGADAKEGDVETEADDTDVDASGEEGTDAPGSDWVTDSVRDLAASYEIDEKELAGFNSEDDFRRHAAILERWRAKMEQKPGKADDKAGDKPPADEHPADEDILDPKAFADDGYDDSTVKIVGSVAKNQRVVKDLLARIDVLEQRLVSNDRQRELDSLNREADALGGRFGKSDSLTSSQQKARDKLFDAAELVRQNLEKRGEKANLSVVLQRAELVAFGDEIIAEDRAKQKEALKRQSAKRRSVGRNTQPPLKGRRPGEAEDPVKAIANSPELVEFWKSAQD